MAVAGTRRTQGQWPTVLLGWPAVFVALCLLAFALFTLAPGTVEGKSLAVLHGLCAQEPTHSYYYGEARLPFDARMTGIYSGFALVGVYFALRGRWRHAAVPDVKTILLLAFLILPLAADGTNSFLKDIQLPYLYEPQNALRTWTGLMVGMSLATFVWMLLGQTAFRPSDASRRPLWRGPLELLGVLVLCSLLAALVGYAGLPVRLPLTYLLMASAVAVVAGLLLPFILLVTRSEQRATSALELAQPATFAVVIALAFIGLLAGSRFFLELVVGVQANTPA